MITIYYRDGRKVKYEAKLAYAIWLVGGVALRVEGDNRPVMSWDYN